MDVRTYDGTMAQREDCVRIKGEFYIKNKQCFRFNEKWHRITNKNVFYNHTKKEYQLGQGNLVEGIVGKNFEKGYFEEDGKRNVRVYKDRSIALNYHVAIANNLRYRQSDGVFYSDSEIRSLGIDINEKSNNWRYQLSRNYNASPYLEKMTAISRDFFKDEDTFVNDNVEHLDNLSFGIEFETSTGIIPEALLFEYGLIPLRDGSITGHEYATVILQGRKDIYKLQKAIKILNQYCDIDNDCSLHVHVGGFNFNEETILAIYRLGCMIEQEIANALFPKMIFNTAKYKSHHKDYCNKLVKFPIKSIDEDFKNLYTEILAGGEYKGRLNETHPKDRDGNHKWNIDNRYKWLNIINLCFGNTNTIEFRIHNATLNPAKVNNWLFICNAFVRFAIMHKKELCKGKKFNFYDILTVYPENIKRELLNYINLRNENKMKDEKKGDVIGDADVKMDKQRIYPNILEIRD